MVRKALGIVGEGVRGEVSSWIKVVPNDHGLSFEPGITESFNFPPLRRVFLGPKAKTFHLQLIHKSRSPNLSKRIRHERERIK